MHITYTHYTHTHTHSHTYTHTHQAILTTSKRTNLKYTYVWASMCMVMWTSVSSPRTHPVAAALDKKRLVNVSAITETQSPQPKQYTP
ncbi:hypothetical protein EON63_02050 [archaeon]|nr:MAG: hypothetical protein EON63_02050 [archaeon]